jgi:flagellar biosynthesis protein FliQ
MRSMVEGRARQRPASRVAPSTAFGGPPPHLRWGGSEVEPVVGTDYFIGVAQQALWVLALACAPILIPALVAGLILGMVQAATSINEQTLAFVPKLIVVAICLALFGGAILTLLGDFMQDMFHRIPDLLH